MNLRFWTIQFWRETGYWLGSSKYLVRKLIAVADIQDATLIVELGAGEWQVTEYLLSKKSPQTKLIVIENDHERFLILESKYGNLCEIHEMSAAHLNTIIEKNSVDIIISTLPLGSISHPWVGHILSAASSILKHWWKFIQFQYALQNLIDVKKHFEVDRIYFEIRNLWPAFIYKTHKK
jgi:phospholipid N-methyltransferase